jgi:hypothetical protein
MSELSDDPVTQYRQQFFHMKYREGKDKGHEGLEEE